MRDALDTIDVLIIEDDSDQIMLYVTKFSFEGISVVAVDSQSEALQHLWERQFDLVLMDILLRGENGLEILEQIKQDKCLQAVPVAMFTNFDNRDARERAQKLGAVDFIVKSDVTPREVAIKVRDIVARQRKT